MSRAAVDACAFKSWYPKYKRITPKATILDLDDAFVDYLKEDGLFLPDDDESDDAYVVKARVSASLHTNTYSARSRRLGSSDDPNGEEAGNDDEDEDAIRRPQYDFSKLSPRIQQVIDEYGAVFPKLNWSSPQVSLSSLFEDCVPGK